MKKLSKEQLKQIANEVIEKKFPEHDEDSLVEGVANISLNCMIDFMVKYQELTMD